MRGDLVSLFSRLSEKRRNPILKVFPVIKIVDIFPSAPYTYSRRTLHASTGANTFACDPSVCVCVLLQVQIYCPPLQGSWVAVQGKKGLVKAASSCCSPEGYSLLTDTCSELTEHFLLRNMYTLHLADCVSPLTSRMHSGFCSCFEPGLCLSDSKCSSCQIDTCFKLH